jgi:hypothetical protein
MGKQERQKVILPQMASSVIGLLMSLSRKGKGAACMAVGETATARMAVSRIWGRGGALQGLDQLCTATAMRKTTLYPEGQGSLRWTHVQK